MAGEGLSVKDRLKLLQQGPDNKNNILSGKIVVHPVTNHKENQSPPTPTKPAFPALKPVTPTNKPGTWGAKPPPTALKPPATPPKPEGADSGGSGGGGGGGEGAVATDKMDGGAVRGAGIQAKLVALRRKASVDNDNVHPIRAGPAVAQRFGGGGGGGGGAGAGGPGKVVNGESDAKPAAVGGKEEGPGVPTATKPGVPTATKPGVPTATKPSDLIKTINQAAADKVLRDSNKPGSENQNRRKSGSEIFLRNSDGKRFRQVDAGSVMSSDPAPPKPRPLEGVDLASFLKAYATAKEEKINVDAAKCGGEAAGSVEDVEELYVEADSREVTIRTRKGSVNRATSIRISKIPEFTEEEEEMEMETYTDGQSMGKPPPPPPEPEVYDDCASDQLPPPPPPENDPDEIYEPLDDLMEDDSEPQPPAASPLPPASPMEKKKDKDKEKEKDKDKGKKKDKAKDESQKKEEKERKKKEEELKKLRAKFGLTDDAQKVGDGVVKANAAGGGLLKSKDLAVSKGETITILRTEGNPTGKWLVENEAGKIGYVNANNIEIDTSSIKNLMTAAKAEEDLEEENPEEIYEPVAEDEEIYEEV